MSIAKKLILAGITIMGAANVSAGQFSGDVCSKAAGHWKGIYTIKDQNTCKLYNGCTHLVMADVSHIADNEYHLTINPAVGNGGELTIKCENGVITSPLPKSKASISCNAMNRCFVVYDDPRLTSEMMHS